MSLRCLSAQPVRNPLFFWKHSPKQYMFMGFQQRCWWPCPFWWLASNRHWTHRESIRSSQPEFGGGTVRLRVSFHIKLALSHVCGLPGSRKKTYAHPPVFLLPFDSKIRGVQPYRAPPAWVQLPNTVVPISPGIWYTKWGQAENLECVTTSGVRIGSLLVFLAQGDNVAASVYRPSSQVSLKMALQVSSWISGSKLPSQVFPLYWPVWHWNNKILALLG